MSLPASWLNSASTGVVELSSSKRLAVQHSVSAGIAQLFLPTTWSFSTSAGIAQLSLPTTWLYSVSAGIAKLSQPPGYTVSVRV